MQKGRFFSHGAFSQRLVKTSADNLKRVYQAAGFSSVTVTPEVKRDGGNISVAFRVKEGPRDIVESLHVVGNTTVPVSTLAPQGLKITEGQPYSTKNVDEDRNQIGAQYLRLGYLNANFRATARPIGKDSHRLDVTYTITEGPKVILGSVATLGAKVTRQSLIDKTVRLKPETPLQEDDMLAAEGRLYSLGIFDWAEIDPRRQITTQTDEDVLVKLHEGRQNDIKYGFGFEVAESRRQHSQWNNCTPGTSTGWFADIVQDQPENVLGASGNVPVHAEQLPRAGRDLNLRGLRRAAGPARLRLLREPSFCWNQLGIKLYALGRA